MRTPLRGETYGGNLSRGLRPELKTKTPPGQTGHGRSGAQCQVRDGAIELERTRNIASPWSGGKYHARNAAIERERTRNM